MEANEGIKAMYSKQNGTVTLETIAMGKLTFLGSSFQRDGNRDTEITGAASFAVKPNETGIIAIVVRANVHWSHPARNEHWVEKPYFLAVDWREGKENEKKPLNLSQSATLPDDRMAWFDRYATDRTNHWEYAITVQIGDELFTTRPNIPGKRYVADADMLCRYLAKIVTAKEVLAAAEEAQKELTAQEQLKELSAQLAQVKKELAEITMYSDHLKKMVRCWLIDGEKGHRPFTSFRRWLTPSEVSDACNFFQWGE